MNIKVIGAGELEKTLRELTDSALEVKAMQSAARAAFKPVIDRARQLVPVKTGELRNAIGLRSVKPKKGDAGLRVGMKIGGTTKKKAKALRVSALARGKTYREFSPAYRWHFVEFGTPKRGARPFIRPAFDEKAKEVVASLRDLFAKRIKAALKKKARGRK